MLKLILMPSIITLSGCSMVLPPNHGTPDAVYSTKSDTKMVAICVGNAFAYDPYIVSNYKEELWGYKLGYAQEFYGEAQVYRKNDKTIVNYFYKNNPDAKMVKYVKDGIQECVTKVYDMSPVGGVQPDGSVKLW